MSEFFPRSIIEVIELVLSRINIPYRYFKVVISFKFARYLENLTGKILRTRTCRKVYMISLEIHYYFFFLNWYRNPLLHVVLYNHTEWLTTLGNTYTVGLTCILWTKSNYALNIKFCVCSALLVFFFNNIYLWKSLTLKYFDLHLENLSSTLDNQLQLVIPPVCQNWTGF